MPVLISKMSIPEHIGLGLFQLELLAASVFSLKAMEPDLRTIGVDPRDILAIGFRKQMETQKAIREAFPAWPEDPPVNRLFHGLCELLFPSEGSEARVPTRTRIAHAMAVVARTREGVLELADRARPGPA